MGKRRPRWTYQRYLKLLKESRGQGTLDNYRPWIEIHDFASSGLSWRTPGITTGRIHHLLSRNEMSYFILLDTDPGVLDIREQFPLRLTETLEIARRLGIKHPWKDDFFFVMTTDFLITRSDGLHARTVKGSEELKNPRVIEKFSIEYAYWESKGVDWKIVTEKQLCADRARTLHWLHTGKSAAEMVPDAALRLKTEMTLLDLLDPQDRLSASAVQTVEEGYDLAPGSAVTLYKDLILQKAASPDLSSPLFC